MGIAIYQPEDLGQAFGGEATILSLPYAFNELNLQRVWLTMSSLNERAVKLYQEPSPSVRRAAALGNPRPVAFRRTRHLLARGLAWLSDGGKQRITSSVSLAPEEGFRWSAHRSSRSSCKTGALPAELRPRVYLRKH